MITPETMSPEVARRIRDAIAACDRTLQRARGYRLHPDENLIRETEAHRARLLEMLGERVSP